LNGESVTAAHLAWESEQAAPQKQKAPAHDTGADKTFWYGPAEGGAQNAQPGQVHPEEKLSPSAAAEGPPAAGVEFTESG